MNYFDTVYEVVKSIPKGTVCTYGIVAVLTGYPGRAKYVGYALHANPTQGIIPCHRVVNKEGKLASAFVFGGIDAQKEMLEAEGVTVVENKVDLTRFLWTGPLDILSENGLK